MDNTRYWLLEKFLDCDSFSAVELAKHIQGNPKDIMLSAEILIDKGYLRYYNTDGSEPFSFNSQMAITTEGRIALSNYREEQAEKLDKKKRDKRAEIRSNIALGVSIFAALVSSATFVYSVLFH